MRIVHFSDTHLGYSDYGRFDSQSSVNQREIDTYNVFKEIVDYIIETKPDLAIHAGDLFDSIRPSNRAIKEALEQLVRLSKAGIPTVIIAGNHSTPRQRSTDSIFGVLQYFENIHPIFEGMHAKLKIGDCTIHAIPHMYSDEHLQQAVAQLKPDKDSKYNVVVAHAAIRGTDVASWGEFKEQTIPPDALSPNFDYVALGHYHRFMKIKDNAYYCGSPERFSFNEENDVKGFLDVELDNFKVTHVPTKAREMVTYGPVDCSNLGAEQVLDAVESLLSNGIEGKIVRVKFDNMPRHVHSSLDLKRIRELVAPALHYDPDYNWKDESGNGASGASRIGSLDEEFENYLKRIELTDSERIEIAALGKEYLEKASEEEAE